MFSLDDLEIFYTGKYFLIFIIAVTTFYIILEILLPLFTSKESILKRWLVNSCFYIINIMIAYNLMPIATEYISNYKIELFIYLSDMPFLVKFLIFLVCIDFVKYWLHVLNHNCRFLWSFHLVHHSDTDVDASTSFRQHPLEYLLINLPLTVIILTVIGAELSIFIIYEMIIISNSLFTHTNLKLNSRLEQVLRLLIVTPNMHRVHHASDKRHTNTNYGILFSFWDRLFKTHCFIKQDQQINMSLGLNYFRKPADKSLLGVLMQPIKYKKVLSMQNNTDNTDN